MVKLKKQISIILILSFFLSLIPNFLYTKSEEVFAIAAPLECGTSTCPYLECSEVPEGEKCCEMVYREEVETCGCINCPISCEWGEEVTNKSCLPFEGTEEWTCGVEIPIGEVMDRSAYLAGKMLVEFDGIIKQGKEMITWGGRVLTDYKKWSCSDYTNWEDEETKCETECRKYYQITAGVLQPAQSDSNCESETIQGKGIYPEECNEDYTQCEYCNDYCVEEEHKEECCWTDNSQRNTNYDPEHPGKEKEYLSCKYCKKEDENGTKYCYEHCFVNPCSGCCDQYFNPIIDGGDAIKDFQENLKNDIDEKSPGGKDLPDNFKFRRSYILEQVDFSRCELARCWIPAEDYYDILAGEKVGKHLLTCETATQMGLFDEDQYFCSVIQILDEWDKIQDLWEELGEAPWWGKPVVFFRLLGRLIMLGWNMLWETIKEWSDSGQEEGCYLTNYYCCQF